jgi:acyl homoserine lactone synthase
MIVFAHGHDNVKYAGLFDQMFRLRARSFAERRGWRVVVNEGRERDHFDDLNPLYIMVTDGSHLLASLRLLQTTGPHMLADIFPETLGDTPVIRHPLVWESTRFCVDTRHAAEHSATGVSTITRELLTGLFAKACEIGLTNIISVYDLYIERILRRAGCRFDRIAPPFEYDGLKTVAGLFEVSEEVVWAIAHRGDDPPPVPNQFAEAPAHYRA